MAATGADIALELVETETAFLDAWPALDTRWEGSWVWREARGYTKRANAIQCQDPCDDGNATERLTRLSAWSREAGIAPMFRQTPLCGPGVIAALDALGWADFEKSRILYLDRLAGDFPVAHRVAISLRAGPAWVGPQCALQGYDAKTARTLADIIARMPETAVGLTVLDDDGVPAASVLAVSVGGLAMFTNVVTSPRHRRQGFGRSAMGAVLNLMAGMDATRAAIHVSFGNSPAENLYAGFGFREIGTYQYRRGPL
jgi:GNAT superfamily N-acetyltransferase